MSLSIPVFVVACFALCALAASAQEWKPAPSPLMTRWAKDVDPANVLPEYPRPQMARPKWVNLNGLWNYRLGGSFGDAIHGFEAATGQILVPFPIESALSGVGKRVEPNQTITYWRRLPLAKPQDGTRWLLHFGAVDYDCKVFVNGKLAGSHTGGYDSFSIDITDLLGESDIESIVSVSVRDATGGFQPRGKQFQKPEGIWYTPVTGIWQTVWAEQVPAAHIAGLRMEPNLKLERLTLTPVAGGNPGAHKVVAIAYDGIKEVARAEGRPGAPMNLSIDSPKTWSPAAPFLYRLKVRMREGGRTVDEVQSYFAMRSIELGKSAAGRPAILLNGKEIFSLGPLDQGFWPDGIYTAPTDEALRFDVEITKQMGFNTIRKHVKVEPARWYYHCDKLGMMVWQDMPSPHFAADPAKVPLTAVETKQFEKELRAMVEQLYNCPSIVMWVPFNEGWGQHETERYVRLMRRWDPSRLLNNASGWTDKGVGDVNDVHNYPNPAMPPIETKRAAVLGEFGGLGLGVDGHTWAQRSWGYQGMADTAALTSKYVELLRRVYDLKERGLTAAIYTQTTDVETECNGFLTYDRAIFKMDLAAVRNANLGKFPKPKPVAILAATAETQMAQWRFTTAPPADGWQSASFDDSNWKSGMSGFGTHQTPGVIIGTVWESNDIWIRRMFQMPVKVPKGLRLRMHHDEAAEVYINGVLACTTTGWTTDYQDFAIAKEALDAIRPGVNTLAVHCRQTSGGQYVDVGLISDK